LNPSRWSRRKTSTRLTDCQPVSDYRIRRVSTTQEQSYGR